MTSKIYTKFLLLATFIIFFGIILFNRYVDPMNIYSEKNHDKFLHIENKSVIEYISLKIFSNKYDYAIVGTSRSQRIDQELFFKHKLSVKNLSISASSIKINKNIISEVKKKNKNVILFLDIYTLAKNNYNKDFKKILKFDILNNEIKNLNSNEYYKYYKYLISKDTFFYSVETFFSSLLNKERDYYWNYESKNNKYVNVSAKKYLMSDYFNGYNIDYLLVKEIGNILEDKDFIVIPPSYYEIYYLMYKKGILQEYFKAIDILIQSKVDIISFIVPSKFLIDKNNYEDGIHFKHQHTDLIINEIFYPAKSAIKLDKFNFEQYKKDLYSWFEKNDFK